MRWIGNFFSPHFQGHFDDSLGMWFSIQMWKASSSMPHDYSKTESPFKLHTMNLHFTRDPGGPCFHVFFMDKSVFMAKKKYSFYLPVRQDCVMLSTLSILPTWGATEKIWLLSIWWRFKCNNKKSQLFIEHNVMCNLEITQA